ncbi:MAG: DUF808 family protein, partial [Pseudomonadota bacterium]
DGHAHAPAIVKGMPGFLKLLSTVGTAAMLWVGGSILVHGAEELGWAAPAHVIHDVAAAVSHLASVGSGFLEWLVTALIDGLIGLGVGLALIPIVDVATGSVAALSGEKE